MFCVFTRDEYGLFLFYETLDKGEAHFEYFMLKELGFDSYMNYGANYIGMSNF